MAEAQRGTRERSGCALALGVLLIGFGALFLALNLNLLDWSALTALKAAAVLFADYWPLILVGWGAFKIFRHFAAPERTRVGFLEVLFLLFVIGCGLTLRTARRFVSETSPGGLDPFFELVELEILGAPAHRFTEQASFEVLPEVAALAIENAAGEVLIVSGASERIDVVLTKRVHHLAESDAERLAEGVSLDFSTSDGGARLAVRRPGGGSRVETDLSVSVPERLSVALSNSRGPVSIKGVAGLVVVETSHGDVEARDLAGGLQARTSHSRIRIDNVKGPVDLRGRSGAIDVRRIQGDLRVVTSYGRLSAEDVEGSATLENRHSSVRADRISGNVDINGEDVEVAAENVGGSVSIRTSHEAIFVRGVQGGATIESRNAAIQVINVAGDVEASALHAPVTVSRIGGSVRVASRPSEVTADDVSGPVSIEGAGERVRVTGFGSRLEIRSTHAELVAATAELSGDVVLETTYGDVELRLPENASARIGARTRDGDFQSEIEKADFVENREGGERQWKGTLGAGSHAIDIATRHGDVRLRSSPQ